MFIDGIKLEELEELEDDETLNVGVIVSGNRLEEHHVWCMIERWYIRQGWWNTAEEYDRDLQQNLYYYLKCSLQNVIYLPKVYESGNADVRVDGCLQLHVHSFHELFSAGVQMHHLGFPICATLVFFHPSFVWAPQPTENSLSPTPSIVANTVYQ